MHKKIIFNQEIVNLRVGIAVINLLHQAGNIFSSLRIILHQEPVMSRKEQIRRRYPFAQLIICFHPADQINNEGAGPVLLVVAKDMGAVGAEDGRALDGIHRNGLQRDSVSR